MCKRRLSVAAGSLVALFASGAGAQLLPRDAAMPSVRPSPGQVPIVVEIREAPAPRLFGAGSSFRVTGRNVAGKPIAVWGAQLYKRDRQARWRPVTAYVMRPPANLRTTLGDLDGFVAPGAGPEYEARATFAIFQDGTCAGNGEMARREVASLREEFSAARNIGMVLAGVPDAPTADHLARASTVLARGLAPASSRRTRQLYEGVLTRLGRAMDARLRSDPKPEQLVQMARDMVDAHLQELEGLPFVTGQAR
jgi:hypothetical protein